MRGRAVLAAVALCGAVAVAGCDGDPDLAPSTSPSSPTTTTSSASPAPTTSPTATPASSIPAAARKQTPEGAKAFVEYFMEQVNLAWTTPSTGLIADNSTSDCKFCNTAEATARWLVEHDQHYAAAPVTVGRLEAISGAPKGQYYVFAQTDSKRERSRRCGRDKDEPRGREDS